MKNKVVTVFGADGFIGSHFVELLLKKNFKVNAVVLYNSYSNKVNLKNIKNKNLTTYFGNVEDYDFCEHVLKKTDYIVNFSALISIPYSYISPESYIKTNIMGALNICRLVRKKINKIKKFVQISTSEVYGSAIYTPIDEEHPLQPQSPYSASKIGSDALCKSFYYTFDIPLVIARPFNTFGPRQSQRAVIPTIINQILNKKKKIKLGNINTKRDFVYVKDTCDAIYKLMKSSIKTNGQVFNISSEKTHSIKKIFFKIKKLLKSNCILDIDNSRMRPIKSEVKLLLGSSKKIKKFCKFKISKNFDKGLSETISWCKNNIDQNTGYHL
jgi:dTDP-D-glucose 4,6-dehydratase